MNYLLEIKAFYDWLEINQLSTSGIVLWHALMHIANKTGWQDTFTVATVVLSTKTGLKRDAFYNARNALQNKGLISFKVRTGNQTAVYKINSFVSVTPTQTPTQVPTQTPTQVPTQTPTQVPTQTPTQVPTQTPTQVPTQTPTQVPTQTPTINKQNKTKQNKKERKPPNPLAGEVQPAAQGEVKKTKREELREIRNSFVFPPALEKKVNEWLRYKQEKQQSYQPTGLHRLLAQIKNKCAEYGEQAVIQVIDMAIANNYQGILWTKITERKRGQGYGTGYGNYGANAAPAKPQKQQQYGDML